MPACDSRADPRIDLVLVRAGPPGPLARRRLAAVARPEHEHLGADRDRVGPEVDAHLVHRYPADERGATPADPDARPTGGRPGDPVRVPEGDEGQVRVARRAAEMVVADASAGCDVSHLDDPAAYGHRRTQAVADAVEARPDADEVVCRLLRVRLHRSGVREMDNLR